MTAESSAPTAFRPSTARSAAEIGRTAAGPRPLPPLDGDIQHTMPTPVDIVLPNGLRVILLRWPSTPMVELRMALPFAGATHEHAATAEVLATTLFRGTARTGHEELHDRLASQGVSLEASRSSRWLNISGSAPGKALNVLLGALSDALTGAAHREDEIARVLGRMARQISIIKAQPQEIAQEALFAQLYGSTASLEEVPRAQAVERVTATRVRELHHAMVRPRGAVLVLAGDLDPERAAAAVAASAASWEDRPTIVPRPVLAPLRDGVALMSRPGAVQSQIRLARHAVDRGDAQFPALSLAALAFGGYFSSRLVTNLRETKGLAYRTDAGFQDHLDQLALTVDADTATEVTVQAYAEIDAELRHLAEVPPSAAEIDAAREYTIGMAMLALTSQSGVAGSVLAAVVLGHDEPDRVTRFPEMLRDVTRQNIADAAAKFFDPAAYGGVVVGDADRLAPGLRDLLGERLIVHDAI